MYGKDGRVGLVVPSSNTTNEPEFARALPDGVSLHASRMRLADVDAESLSAMADDATECASLLASAEVDVVAYGCTTGSLVHGPGYDEDIEARLEAEAGVPAVATAASIKRAFDVLDVDSVAVTTPYIEDLNRREAEFLEAAGYDVVAIDGLGLSSNTEIGAQDPQTAADAARNVDDPDADAVFISCTNYRTFDIIPELERELDKPVVTSNQATLWDALDRLEAEVRPTIDLGRLFG
ncbi:MAG TPA: maleate cis-trans isomerase [Natrialbaceae archaeon]|nr:maleate cis-trans isomerase [Natrialbaceae archaeon]